MKTKETSQTLTLTSPASATTAVGASAFTGAFLQRAEALTIDAKIIGGTGGTLDVYLQRKIASDSWLDWVHFPQVAAATTKRYTLTIVGNDSTIVETGGGSDAAPGVALAAGTAVNVTPGDTVRVVFVAGVGTSLGASQVITITPYTERMG